MVGRIVLLALLMLAPTLPLSTPARAQDVPGVEICTVEKSMERRTSCLQSNVDFLQKTIGKLTAEYQQKLNSAARQIESLKATVGGLQRAVDELQAARNKALEDPEKKIDVPAAGNGAPAKESGK
jgi:prefoldin subunit 5